MTLDWKAVAQTAGVFVLYVLLGLGLGFILSAFGPAVIIYLGLAVAGSMMAYWVYKGFAEDNARNRIAEHCTPPQDKVG